MSIANSCPDCCECPAPIVQWDSVGASKTKCGILDEFVPSTPPKIYRTFSVSGSVRNATGRTNSYSASETLGFDCSTISQSGTITDSAGTTCAYAGSGANWQPEFDGSAYFQSMLRFCPDVEDAIAAELAINSQTSTTREWKSVGYSSIVTQTLSDEYTTTLLITNTLAALGAFPGTWDGTPGAYRNVSDDELSCAARKAQYRFAIPVPKVRTGKLYRLTWIERFVPEVGVPITSIGVEHPGSYRPAVTIGPGYDPDTDTYYGEGAEAIAVMNATGGVASICVINPGSGYSADFPPTIQVAESYADDSTGWEATVEGGLLVAIAGGTEGDYLPTLTLSAPLGGGTQATAEAVMDENGGIASVTLTDAGSAYQDATITVIPKTAGSVPPDRRAIFRVNLGTQTARCATWDGVVPEDYDEGDPGTWPIIPGYEIAVPSSDGLTTVVHVRAVCDGSDCP